MSRSARLPAFARPRGGVLAPAFALAFALAFACEGCGATTSRVDAPVTTLDGEVTVHGFSDWTHAWAVMLAPGVPAADVHLDTLLALPAPPSTIIGACTITPSPRCAAPCGPGQFCQADDRCAPLPTYGFVDEGAVTVSGGQGEIPTERLAFDAATGLYASAPPAGRGRSFAGGERLTTVFASGFAPPSTLRAPQPVVLSAVPSPLHFPSGTPLALAWTSGDGELIEILLTASTAGRSVAIRCLSVDGGWFAVAPEVLAALPAPPREIHLEVTRNAEVVAPTRPGHGVRVHVGYTVTADGED